MMQKLRWAGLIFSIITALAIAIQNNDSAEIQLFFFSRTMPLSILLLITTAIGFLIGAIATVLMLRRREKRKTEKV